MLSRWSWKLHYRALARAGVGELIIVDDDTVCLTN
ncbi:tRNA A37 threonylcarbamoyladenosine dehydratase [Clostridium beijerinckii]|nr:tRNA A37 threonylcarbamoyladenosine dehydratase [Clostridium beijerinckii]